MPFSNTTSTTGFNNNSGFLNIKSNTQIDSEFQERIDDANETQREPEISNLAGFVSTIIDTNIHERNASGMERQLYRDHRQYKGEYDPDKLALIRETGGSEININETGVKCRAASSLFHDLFIPKDGKSWEIIPTPNPQISEDSISSISENVTAGIISDSLAVMGIPKEEITPEIISRFIQEKGAEFFIEKGGDIRDEIDQKIMEKAFDAAGRMSDLIEDQLVEGKFKEAFSDFLIDVPIYAFGCIKWELQRVKTLTRERTFSGTQVVVKEKVVKMFRRISPFDIFFGPDNTSPQDGTIVERRKFTRKNLMQLKGTKGADSNSIDLVISKFEEGSQINPLINDTARDVLEDRSQDEQIPRTHIDGYEVWASVPGFLLEQWKPGFFPKLKEGEENFYTKDYDVRVIIIMGVVVLSQINPDPLGRRPYYVSSFVKNPGSIMGLGVPLLMRDSAGILNAAGRALVNNMAFGSGPILGVHNDRLADGEVPSKLQPLQTIQLKNPMNQSGRALEFYQPPINSDSLINVITMAKRFSDDSTGLPAFLTGNTQTSGAGRTATGLNLLQGNSKLLITLPILDIDKNVVRRIIEDFYNHNMLFIDDPLIKGDLKIRATGLLGDIVKDRKLQGLQAMKNSLFNEVGLRIVGDEGIAKLLREEERLLDLKDIIPTEEQLEASLRNEKIARQQQAQALQEQQQLDLEQELLVQDDEQDFELEKQGREHDNQIRIERMRQIGSFDINRLKDSNKSAPAKPKGTNQTVRNNQ